MKQIKSPTIFQALFPIIFLVVLLIINVSVFGDDALSGSMQIVLILSSAVASIIAFNLGFTWL
ncbi:MAG: sodium:proton antiporter, partial [Bacteroidota bacterium]|nr:sodium:proton antiporter [Bacteroidota bacterium]